MSRPHGLWCRLRRGDDSGQVMVLTIGFVVVALLLVTVVVSATGVHLRRKRLLDLADMVALEAADALSDDAYYQPDDPSSGGVPLTDASVRAAVDEYLRANRRLTAGFEDFQVLSAGTSDGRSATVRLGAVTRPVLGSVVLAPWGDGIAMEATATARAY